MNPDEESLAIVGAAKVFKALNPGYRRSTKTFKEMVEYMDENGLPKTEISSWQAAYDGLCRDEVGFFSGNFRPDGSPELYDGREALDMMPADKLKDALKNEKFARGANLVLEDQ